MAHTCALYSASMILSQYKRHVSIWHSADLRSNLISWCIHDVWWLCRSGICTRCFLYQSLLFDVTGADDVVQAQSVRKR